jgi:hypothetical protein
MNDKSKTEETAADCPHWLPRLVRRLGLDAQKGDREEEGYISAKQCIEQDGGGVEVARKHRADASSDLDQDSYTRGWKRACDEIISANVESTREGRQEM